jgi:hypothetical protein
MINVLVGCFLQKKIKRYNFFYQNPFAVIPIKNTTLPLLQNVEKGRRLAFIIYFRQGKLM